MYSRKELQHHKQQELFTLILRKGLSVRTYTHMQILWNVNWSVTIDKHEAAIKAAGKMRQEVMIVIKGREENMK